MSGNYNQENYQNYQDGYSSYTFEVGDTPAFGSVGSQPELNFQNISHQENVQPFYPTDSFVPSGNFEADGTANDFDEPPLLEELGIDPDRILKKTLAVLNPFHQQGLVDDATFITKDTDLAGPLVFCLFLGGTLLLSGGKANFGYIYGLAVIGCLLMYIVLSLMNTSGTISVTAVASILGYCLLPVVGLSVLSVIFYLHNIGGVIIAIIAVTWCSLSASRLFASLMASDYSQRPLIAYPCFLLYGVFILIVVF